ncbi:GntR family transcriptional regulator [Alteribacter natronophilus]|uniref:GntR family transcriptional regulator n=1 Tax=Alteribacter natronophilus TaxID=2583810 RepID=UPI00110E3A35|nr:GntR family transcriptional regulator [Alteribacter natronophilus]TMW72256.1 GntR family transcriptional regulator [Alteribacter natronophilus]
MEKIKRSAYQHAYETIRDKILNGNLTGGEKIVEDRLATELRMSRTPVREAIRKLEEEGLIKSKKVINPTSEELRQTFEVRVLLECHAVRCAALYMDENRKKQLYECVVTASTGSRDEVMAANERFHTLIVHASSNPVLVSMIERMSSVIYLFRREVVYYNRPNLIDEHRMIYKAINEGDADLAEKLMKNHLEADLAFSLHSPGFTKE